MYPPNPRRIWLIALAGELRRVAENDDALAPDLKATARRLELRATGGDPGMVVTTGLQPAQVVSLSRDE